MKNLLRYVFAYGLWLISIVSAAYIGLIVRDVVSSAFVVNATDTVKNPADQFYVSLQLRAMEPWWYIVYGILIIILIPVIEHVYRTAVNERLVLARFFLISAIEVGVLALSQLGQLGINLKLGGAVWPGLLLPLVEIVATGTLIGLYIWIKRRYVDPNIDQSPHMGMPAH